MPLVGIAQQRRAPPVRGNRWRVLRGIHALENMAKAVRKNRGEILQGHLGPQLSNDLRLHARAILPDVLPTDREVCL